MGSDVLVDDEAVDVDEALGDRFFFDDDTGGGGGGEGCARLKTCGGKGNEWRVKKSNSSGSCSSTLSVVVGVKVEDSKLSSAVERLERDNSKDLIN